MPSGHPASDVWYVRDLVERAHARESSALSQRDLRTLLAAHLQLPVQPPARGDARSRGPDGQRVRQGVREARWLRVPRRTFSAWLFRIAHNQLIDHVRSRSRTTQVPLDDAFEVRQPSSFKGLDRRLAVDQIKLAMSTLTEEQRQGIGMRFVEGLGAAEVARRMGRTEEAVKKLQARGLAALKRGMDCRSGCWSVTMGASS